MRRGHVLLLSMPWEQLENPSIQLGLLGSVLERAGIPAATRSLNLDFMEHCVAATAGLPEHERLSVGSYRGVVRWSRDVSVGDWIFSSALSSTDEEDGPYLAFLEELDVPSKVVDSALRFRALVRSFLERVADEISDTRPAIVGFTTAFNQTLASLALATELRARLGDAVRIVFGGANCEGSMGAALHRAFPVIDMVVRGEGERALPELARDLLAGRAVRAQPGLCYRENGTQVVHPEAAGAVPLDEIPTPRYDEYFERLGQTSFAPRILRDVTILYESARGCWWGEKSHCSFCGISDLALSFRKKSPERVLEELAELAQRYGRLDFFFVDYILSRTYFDELLPRLRDAGYDLRIFCETKANLRREHVQLLREAGFTAIQAGVESLSTPTLKLMRKGVTALQNLRLLKWCAEESVRLYWNILYGIPGESPDEFAAMADLVPSLVHLEPPRLVPLQLDRFSPYFESTAEFGIVPLGPRRDFRFVYPRECVDDATLSEIAYSFEFRYDDGRDPNAYTSTLRRAVREWQSNGRRAIGTLTYRRGPGFLIVSDRRPGLERAEYHLGDTEARIYLACEDGATEEQAWRAGRSDASANRRRPSPDDVGAFLEQLVASRLACKIDGRYLALALPHVPRRAQRVRGLEVESDVAAASGTPRHLTLAASGS
jgi:ribosomal peptide maturation radical SAM protein 1